MEHEPIKYPTDDVEDGEISDSDDGYTPLQRPEPLPVVLQLPSAASTSLADTKMEEATEQEDSPPEEASSDSDSDGGFNSKPKQPKLRMKPLTNLQATATHQSSAVKNKKYNIWTAGMQEESLMENLKGCGVDQDSFNYDRKSEQYDYTLKYRLNGENTLKRRQVVNSSGGDDDDVVVDCFASKSQNKRFRANSMGQNSRKNVRLRLGHRSGGDEDDSSSNDSQALRHPRVILDLNITADMTHEDVARELANKLYEEKDELMLRIVEVLGTDLPVQIFKETQIVESNGGMMIMNGMRRRTPGGVYLFLLKNSHDLASDQKRLIFSDESKKQNKEQKLMQAMKRDRKVEELKQTLKNENDHLTVLSTRSDLHLNAESHANLSNPPPSPVTDGNRENSSDFDTHEHVVNVTSPEKATTEAVTLAPTQSQLLVTRSNHVQPQNSTYDDDFLDMHCDDMDLF